MSIWGDSLEMVAQSSKDINSRIRHLKTEGAPSWCSVVGSAYENMERVVQYLETAIKIKNRKSADKDIEEIIKKCSINPPKDIENIKKAKKAKKPKSKKAKAVVRDLRGKEQQSEWAVEIAGAYSYFETRQQARDYVRWINSAPQNVPVKLKDLRKEDKGWAVFAGSKEIYFNKRDDARKYMKDLKKIIA